MNDIKTVMDVELQMHAFRLMRSGAYRTAKAIKEAMAEEFPNVSPDRLSQVLAGLARRLLENS